MTDCVDKFCRCLRVDHQSTSVVLSMAAIAATTGRASAVPTSHAIGATVSPALSISNLAYPRVAHALSLVAHDWHTRRGCAMRTICASARMVILARLSYEIEMLAGRVVAGRMATATSSPAVVDDESQNIARSWRSSSDERSKRANPSITSTASRATIALRILSCGSRRIPLGSELKTCLHGRGGSSLATASGTGNTGWVAK